MKKVISLVLAAVLLVSALCLTSCSGNTTKKIVVGASSPPTPRY